MHKKWRRLLVKKQLDLKNVKDVQVDLEDKVQSQDLVKKPKKKGQERKSQLRSNFSL